MPWPLAFLRWYQTKGCNFGSVLYRFNCELNQYLMSHELHVEYALRKYENLKGR